MKTISFALLLAGLASLAQGQAAASAANSAEQSRNPVQTVEGCLTYSNGQYVITGGAPGPKQYRIIGGDTSALKHKEQYTVKVTGPVGTNNAEENMTTPYNAGSTTGVGWNTIEAQKIQVVFANCSEPGKAYPAK